MLFSLLIKNILRGVVHHTYLSIDPLKPFIEPANTRYSEQFCVISRKGACIYTCFIKGYGFEAVVSRLVWGRGKGKVFFNLRSFARVLPPSPLAFPSNSHPARLMRFQKKMRHFFLSTSGQKYATIGPAPRLATSRPRESAEGATNAPKASEKERQSRETTVSLNRQKLETDFEKV